MGGAGRPAYVAGMDTTPVSATDRPARGLQRWMRAVGGLYLLLGAASFPPQVAELVR
jgi:hypothetical protein